jgi:phosphoglycerate dehydrogenase-like enzyme
VLTNKTVLNGALIATLPELRYIRVMATGYNVVDLAAARARRIPSSRMRRPIARPRWSSSFALLFELTHHVGRHARGVREGRWNASPDFCYWEIPLVELAGRTFGIVGFGTWARASPASRPRSDAACSFTRTPPREGPGRSVRGLPTVFRESDGVARLSADRATRRPG